MVRWDQDSAIVADHGQVWEAQEDALVGPDQLLERIPAHRASYFGWVAQFPESRLIR